MNTTWKKDFAESVAQKIGFYIEPERVTLAKRRDIYLPEADEWHPTVLCCRDGALTVDVPKKDFHRLENEEISIEDYINQSHWLYGFFVGFNATIMKGAFITPLERKPGIHDKDKIWRFLKITFCRIEHDEDSFMPSIRKCHPCKLKNCPVSRYKSSYGNYAAEPGMIDNRWDLLSSISHRIHEEFGFLINRIYPMEDLEDKNMVLLPYDKKDMFDVYVSDSLIRSILYHPRKSFEFTDIVKVMNVSIKKHYDDSDTFVFDSTQFHNVVKRLGIEEDWDEKTRFFGH